MLKEVLKRFSPNKTVLAILLLVGSITLSLTMVKSGLNYNYGLGFWGPNGHDGIWHLALIQNIAKGSWEMPTFAGELIKNYHLGFDLIVVALTKISTIPASILYFQVLPVIFAFLVGYLTHKFVLLWTREEKAALWSTFFVYFGGSFGFVVTLVKERMLGGESLFWSQQAISTLINPPFALSLILILLGLIHLLEYYQDNLKINFILSVIYFGLLIQIKVYAGLLCLGGLLIAGLYQIIVKKEKKTILVFLASLFVSTVLFMPMFKNSSGIVVFKPFWFLETMMGFSDRLGWKKFYSAMTNYRLGSIWIKGTIAYLVAFAIFLLGNWGTRVVGILSFIKDRSNSTIKIFLLSLILAGIIIPTFFLQKGTPWNTIQFFYYSLFALSILAGVGMLFVKNRFLMVLLVLLTIPTTIGTLGQYLPDRPPAKIGNDELSALNFLAKQEKGVVLTYPYDAAKAKEAVVNPPRSLYLYDSTAYVAAYSQKPVFLEDQVNLDITGFAWQERRQKLLDFVNSSDKTAGKAFLRENKIKYIYELSDQIGKAKIAELGTTKIFENNLVKIYSVNY